MRLDFMSQEYDNRIETIFNHSKNQCYMMYQLNLHEFFGDMHIYYKFMQA